MCIFSWISKNCILKLHIKVCNWYTYRLIKVFPWQRVAMKILFSSIEVNGRIQLWITITLIYIEIIPCNLVTASLLIMSLMGTKKMIIFFFSLFFAVWLRLASLCIGPPIPLSLSITINLRGIFSHLSQFWTRKWRPLIQRSFYKFQSVCLSVCPIFWEAAIRVRRSGL